MDKFFANSSSTIAQIKEALAPIAAKMGQGVEFAWGTVVRQQYVEGIADLVWAAMALVVAIFFSTVAVKYAKSSEGGSLLALVPALIAIIVFASCLTDGIMHMLSPNYYALDFFINLGKTATTK